MLKYLKSSPLFYSYVVMLLVIFLLPFYSLPGYSIVKNTTSQLAAQNTPNAWIMNFIFCALGFSTIYEGFKKFKSHYYFLILLLLFGGSLVLTAIFSHAPIDSSLSFNVRHDELHSLFASVTGFSFTFFAISMAFFTKKHADKLLAVSIAVLATVLSLLMFNFSEFAGVWQRGIFITTFVWLLYVFSFKKRIV